MGTNIVQTGSGPTRDVWVAYHAGGLEVKLAAGPSAVVIGETRDAFAHHYDHVGPGAVRSIAELLTVARGVAGSFDVGRLVLVGFSEGAQAVRLHLASGVVPSAALCVDGAHAATGLPPAQIDPWARYASRAATGDRVFTLTHSAIPTTGYESTTAVAAAVVAAAGLVLGPEKPTDDGGQAREQGDARIVAYPGADKAAHIYQGTVVLPHEAGHLADRMGSRALPPSWPLGATGGGTPTPKPPIPPKSPSSPGSLASELAGILGSIIFALLLRRKR